MRILLLGAAGFIGREILAALRARGHRVVPAVRSAASAPPFATERAIEIDLDRDIDAATWMPRLAGIDAVVNCAGILQGTGAHSIDAIHRLAPIALFDACARAGVRRVIQVSAISAERAAGTAYAVTKLAADDHLRASDLDWIVVRPSLVVARGAHGGTALLRAMAALPFAIPVPSKGEQLFQPIFIDDLAALLVRAVETDTLARRTLDAVGPDVVALRALLEDYRRWLGFESVPAISIPAGLVKAAARLGDLLGGPLNSTSLAQLEYGNTGDYAAFNAASGIEASGWKDQLALHPAHVQDRWHARLYFVRPILRATLALLWLFSGFAGLVSLGQWAPLVASGTGIPVVAAGVALLVACVANIAIAAFLLRRWKPRTLALAQVLAICGYSVAATILWPSLWAESLGPLLKNVPVLGAVLALGAIEEERR
jgi:uncharacterized protein YbjT (DUF2867 family)